MNNYELFAIQYYLTKYPDNASYDDIIEHIKQGNDCAVVWEPFEYTPVDTLTDYIDHMTMDLRAKFVPRKKSKFNVY